MKALSVRQPRANMIASGKKTVETRTWSTQYRGDLLICASRSGSIEPRGVGLCIVELYACRPMTRADEGGARCRAYPGAWAWLLRNIRPLEKPFKVQGQLGLFEVEIPSPGRKLRYGIPSHATAVRCKGCLAMIYFVPTRPGRSMPVNPDGTPHWGTCPKAKEFKAGDAIDKQRRRDGARQQDLPGL